MLAEIFVQSQDAGQIIFLANAGADFLCQFAFNDDATLIERKLGTKNMREKKSMDNWRRKQRDKRALRCTT